MASQLARLESQAGALSEWRGDASRAINNLTSGLDGLVAAAAKRMADGELETARLGSEIEAMGAGMEEKVTEVYKRLAEPAEEATRARRLVLQSDNSLKYNLHSVR